MAFARVIEGAIRSGLIAERVSPPGVFRWEPLPEHQGVVVAQLMHGGKTGPELLREFDSARIRCFFPERLLNISDLPIPAQQVTTVVKLRHGDLGFPEYSRVRRDEFFATAREQGLRKLSYEEAAHLRLADKDQPFGTSYIIGTEEFYGFSDTPRMLMSVHTGVARVFSLEDAWLAKDGCFPDGEIVLAVLEEAA